MTEPINSVDVSSDLGAVARTSSKQRCIWDSVATLALISSYKQYQPVFKNPKQKHLGWQMVSADLQSVNIEKGVNDCRIKWSNIVRTYKIVKDNKKKTGAGSMRFAYFNEIDEILGEKISNRGGHTLAAGIRGVVATRPPVISSESINVTTEVGSTGIDEVLNNSANNVMTVIASYDNPEIPEYFNDLNTGLNVVEEDTHEEVLGEENNIQQQQEIFEDENFQQQEIFEEVNIQQQEVLVEEEYIETEIHQNVEKGRKARINWRNEYFKKKNAFMEENNNFKQEILTISLR